MTSPATQLSTQGFASGGLFSPDALETNRAGGLTDLQRRQFTGIERRWRRQALSFAAILAVIGVLILTSTGPAPNAAYRPLAGAAFLVVAAALLVYYLPGGDRLTDDLRGGRVVNVEGAMEKHTLHTSTEGASTTSYYLDVADKHFKVDSVEYKAAPEHGWVRLYYLPRSHRVVNLEQLPDPPLPESLAHPTMESVRSVFGEIVHSKGEAHHEAAARLAQMSDAMKASMESMRAIDLTPPAAAGGDARPLAEAIVGRWEGGPISVTFEPDGTIEMTTLGRVHRGHWSVDSDGRLRADVFGREGTGNAWVVGDVLTVTFGGEGIKLQRAS